MKSNNFLKSYHSFLDARSSELVGGKFAYSYLMIYSPFYGAIEALQKEVTQERQRIDKFIDNTTVELAKTIKPRMMKTDVKSLFTLSSGKKEIVNTLRAFCNILEKECVNAY